MNLIIVPSHSRKLYLLNHLLDRFEVETEYKVELLQAFQWCLEVLRWLCESCFQKYMAQRGLLVQYVHIRRNSSCCKRSWKRTAHGIRLHCKCTWLTREVHE